MSYNNTDMTCENCEGCFPSSCDELQYYGGTCNLTCSVTCRVLPCASCECAVCNVTSGQCLNGCNYGWFGSVCEYVCPQNCTERRQFPDKCAREFGTCLYGCTDGFYGDYCNQTCGFECENTVCNQTSGACAKGCIYGYTGDFCQERSAEMEDQLAGAVGGAVVIILWGVIVIILIYVIWRRRQKEYETFNRNRSLNHGRGSSRRQLTRQRSVSSGSTCMQHGDPSMEHCNYEIILPEFEVKRPPFARSYSDETPMMHLCAHHSAMELRYNFRKKCNSFQTSREYDIPDEDEVPPGDVIKPASSEEEEEGEEEEEEAGAEGSSEMIEMWKIRKF